MPSRPVRSDVIIDHSQLGELRADCLRIYGRPIGGELWGFLADIFGLCTHMRTLEEPTYQLMIDGYYES